KQNVDIDFYYNGPADTKDLFKSRQFDAFLSKFNITNDIYASESSFQAKQELEGDKRSGRFMVRSKTTASPLYDITLQDTMRGIIKEIYEGSKPEYAQFRSPNLPKTQEELYALIAPVLP